MTDYKSMFEQAVRTLAAIDDALGIGDDGCGDPEQTLYAIDELKSAVRQRDELVAALRHISLASQSSMGSKHECGLIARAAIAIVGDGDTATHNASGKPTTEAAKPL